MTTLRTSPPATPKKPNAIAPKSDIIQEEIIVQRKHNTNIEETRHANEIMGGNGERFSDTRQAKPDESNNDEDPITTTNENCVENQHKYHKQSHKQIIKASLEMVKKGLEKVNMINSTASSGANKASAIDHLENAARQLEAVIENEESPRDQTNGHTP
jgi:hypothetical protein